MFTNGQIDRLLVASGIAAVRLYGHDVKSVAGPPVACWSYASEGLGAFGQREIVLTLRRAAREDRPPGDGIALLEALARAAKGGQTVDRGGTTEFGPRGFLNNPALRGLVYAPAQYLTDVDVVPGALAAITLFGDELEAVKRFGATRVLARLGRANEYFPFPPWGERSRQPAAGGLESLLAGFAGLTLPDASATIEGDSVVLRLSPRCAPLLARALPTLPPDAALALHVGLAPDAPACLVWSPGQTGPEAISTPGADAARVGACFVAFVPQQAADEARLFEDGAFVALTDASWAALREALGGGRAFRLERGAGTHDLAVEWAPAEYINPIDGSILHAPGGWRTYRPQAAGPAAAGAGAALAMRVALLTPDAELRAAVDVDVLAEYVTRLEAETRGVVAGMPAQRGTDLVVQVTLAPGLAPAFAYAVRPEVPGPDAPLRAQLPGRLALARAPGVRGRVQFHLIFDLWGGAPPAPAAG